MPTHHPALKTAQWKNLTRKLKNTRAHVCWICGGWIDDNAPPRTRWAISFDHVVPLSKGGAPFDPGNVEIAHVGCNARRSAHGDTMPTDTGWKYLAQSTPPAPAPARRPPDPPRPLPKDAEPCRFSRRW